MRSLLLGLLLVGAAGGVVPAEAQGGVGAVSKQAPASVATPEAAALEEGWTVRLRRGVQGWGAWAPLFYVLAFTVATTLMVPGSPFAVTAGLSFGLLWGTLLTWIASTLTVSICFLLARRGVRGRVEDLIEGHPVAAALDRIVARNGWKVVALTRLSSFIPFNLQSYAYGLTAIRFGRYLLVSWICMLPATVLFVYAGARGSEMTTAGPPGALELAGVGIGVMTLVYLAHLTRRALREASASEVDGTSEPVHVRSG